MNDTEPDYRRHLTGRGDHLIRGVVIYRAKRTGASPSGNPGYELHTNVGVLRMLTDASLGYGIENYTNSRFSDRFVIGNPDNPKVDLLCTRVRGVSRVWGIGVDGQVLL